MRHRQSAGEQRGTGFTLVELMIVIAIIAIIAAIAIPNLLSARLNANQSAAVAMLRTISTAQTQFQASAKADEDIDGVGEYGYFAELGGTIGPRRGRLRPPNELTGSLGSVNVDGEVSRSGYVMRIYLPEAGGVGHREESGGGVTPGVLDPDQSEVLWCAYAWPVNFGSSGNNTYFMHRGANVSQAEESDYSGHNLTGFQVGAALLTGDATRMTGLPALGTIGADGNNWRQVQ